MKVVQAVTDPGLDLIICITGGCTALDDVSRPLLVLVLKETRRERVGFHAVRAVSLPVWRRLWWI